MEKINYEQTSTSAEKFPWGEEHYKKTNPRNNTSKARSTALSVHSQAQS